MKWFNIFFKNIIPLLLSTTIFACALLIGIGEADTTPPNIVISSPADGSVYGPGVVIISGAATDNDKIKEVLVQVGGSGWTSLGAKNVWDYNWSTTGTGPFVVNVRAIDNVGNEATNTVNIIVDSGGPVITFSTPVSNTYHKYSISTTGTVADDSGISNVSISLDGINWTSLYTGGQKSYNWNTSIQTTNTNITDGFYNIYIRATDISSIVSFRYVAVFVNNEISNLVFSPQNEKAINGIEYFQGTILLNNPTFLSNVKFTAMTNNVVVTNLNFSGNMNYSFGFDSSILPSGTVVVSSIIAETFSGLCTTNQLTNYVDKTYPNVYITSPSNGSYLRLYDYSFEGYGIDDTGITKVDISFDNTTFSPAAFSNFNGTNYWYTNINSGNLAEGLDEFYVTVYDLNGKTKSQRIIFTVDKTLPSITISSPLSNTTVQTNFLIDAVAYDANAIINFLVKLDSIVVASNLNLTVNSYLYTTFITNTSGEGAHNLSFEAYDSAGNSYNKTIQISVNQNPAKTTNITLTSPGGSQIYLRGTAAIGGVSYDSGALSNVYIQIDNSGWSNILSTNALTVSWTHNLDTTVLSDGLHILKIRAEDNLRGFNDYQSNIYIDNNKPFAVLPNVPDYAALGGLFQIQSYITDNVSLYSLQIETNGNNAIPMTNITGITTGTLSKIYQFNPWDLTAFPDGITNMIVTIVVDKVLQTNKITNFYIVSNNIPIITIDAPALSAYVSSNITVSGNAYRSPEGVMNAEIKIGTNSYATATVNNLSVNGETNNFSYLMNTKVVSEGNQVISVRVTSSNGSFNVKTVPVIVDYSPPSVSILSPTNNESYFGSVNLSGTASDNNSLTNIFIYIIQTNGTPVAGWNPVYVPLVSGSWSTNWNTASLPVGVVDIIAEAVDLANNISRKTNRVIIRPYITAHTATNNATWIANTFSVDGFNFGSSTVQVAFKGATNSVTGSGGTNASTTVGASTKSGYMQIIVNGIESINSNWIDIWEFSTLATVPSGQINSRITFLSNKFFAVQGSKNGSTWASNVFVSDYSGSTVYYNITNSTIPNGEVIGAGNGIDINGTVMAMIYSPAKMTGVFVTTYTNSGSSWIKLLSKKIDTVTVSGIDPLMDVKIGTDNSIHVTYSDQAGGVIKYAVSSDYGNNFTVESAVTGVTFDPVLKDGQPSIDIDSSGNPHILYYDYATRHLKHAFKSGLWSSEVVDNILLNGQYSDIKIDSSGMIHASYYNGDSGDLLYSFKASGGNWMRDVIDLNAITGYYTSIDLFNSQKAISYYSTSYSTGWLAYYNGSTWRVVSMPQHSSLGVPYGKYSGVKFNLTGDEVWVGFIDSTLKLFLAKYKK